MATNGIDFVIGGKDQAKPAMASVEKSLQRLEQKTSALSGATSRLSQVTSVLASAYVAVKGAMAAIGGINALNAAYDQQAEAVKGLEVALKLQGASVGVESSRLQKFAGDMQKLTGVGDEVTLGLMQQAAMLGVNADQLDDAAKAAIGLSEASGRGLAESMKLVNGALAGEFGAFGEIIPAIKTMTTEEEKLAAVLAFTQRGLDAKAEASHTVAGMSERASGAIGDLMEAVGALLAPVRVLISAGLQTLAESLQTVLAPAVEYATGILENIGPMVDWVKDKVITGVNLMIEAFTFFEVILTNLDSVWTLVVAQAELYMLQLSGVVMHILTEVIPAHASWFAENFVNILRDGFNLAFTVVSNQITKIVDVFSALWEFIASGGSTDILGKLGDIAGRSYLEGFQSSLADLPTVVPRAITDREKELTKQIGAIGGALGDEFAQKMSERIIKTSDDLALGVNSEIDLQVNRTITDTHKASGINTGKNSEKSEVSINATESRLLTRGPGSTFETQILDSVKRVWGTIEEQNELARKTAEELEKINKNTANTTQLVPAT